MRGLAIAGMVDVGEGTVLEFQKDRESRVTVGNFVQSVAVGFRQSRFVQQSEQRTGMNGGNVSVGRADCSVGSFDASDGAFFAMQSDCFGTGSDLSAVLPDDSGQGIGKLETAPAKRLSPLMYSTLTKA